MLKNQIVWTCRGRLSLSQADLANVLGVSRLTLSRWERGESPLPAWAQRLLILLRQGKIRPADLVWAREQVDRETHPDYNPSRPWRDPRAPDLDDAPPAPDGEAF